ncbi:uncharacterized protein C6G9.01c-like [Selaginella moellendorffii]|uniref:uncharacterized protein C6G9.01c-like n=1 Tax=Selaginella moellendorffii TaxID=88036 RepID=UPI000D1CFCFD|nr:uncharacterized protein C6G9.01c-like [Selaginella moellendorffii]|eukprot:XP_024535809.1 uncharacterized protein C6G9.01c-like [Selaginella moellendorffii]
MEEKRAASTAKAENEIDAIFAEKSSAKKRKKPAVEQEQQPKARKRVKKKKKNAAKNQEEKRKKTQEGFSVYTEEELGCNKKDAGGTALCPFDCDCCF